MANQKDGPAAEVQTVKVVSDVPVFFADNIVSQSYGAGISKFYFARIDTDVLVAGPNRTVPVAQAIMPAEGFARAVAFFNHRLKLMVRDGVISQEAVDEIFSFKYDDADNG